MSGGAFITRRVRVTNVVECVAGRVLVTLEVERERLVRVGDGPCDTIGARIAARRGALGLSQSELARRAGVCQQDISRAERTGGERLALATASKVVRVLGVSLEWLAGGSDGR